jgi:hypothetical protein
MAYPLDQLMALAKANLDLSLRLAEIARRSGLDSLQAAAKAASAFGETNWLDTDVAKKTSALSEKGSNLFGEAGQIREQMVADTKTAFEQWQQALKTAFTGPDQAK